jgi:hypothetical protein
MSTLGLANPDTKTQQNGNRRDVVTVARNLFSIFCIFLGVALFNMPCGYYQVLRLSIFAGLACRGKFWRKLLHCR